MSSGLLRAGPARLFLQPVFNNSLHCLPPLLAKWLILPYFPNYLTLSHVYVDPYIKIMTKNHIFKPVNDGSGI